MEFYRVIDKTTQLAGGLVIGVSDAKDCKTLSRRKHRLEPVNEKKSIYKTREVLPFKQGEIFGLEGDLPKNNIGQVELVNPTKAKSKAKRKAKRKPTLVEKAMNSAKGAAKKFTGQVESDQADNQSADNQSADDQAGKGPSDGT